MIKLKSEGGYTLAELLIVIAILGMVLAGIVTVLQPSQQTYTRASSQEDAQVGARVGLDGMATELRLTGSYVVGATGAPASITAATASTITFVGDVNGDTVSNSAETTVTQSAGPGSTVRISGNAAAFSANERLYIANGSTRELRQIGSIAGTTITLNTPLVYTYPVDSIVRSVETVTYARDAVANTLTRAVGGGAADVLVNNVTGLAFTYFDADGFETANLAQIREIQIALTTQGGDGSSRTMTSRVKPRNLN